MPLTSAARETLPLSARFMARLRGDSLQSPWGAIMVFLSPALLVYAAFTIYPVLRTFYNSVHIIKPRGVEEFVGLANFVTLFTRDMVFWKSVTNTMIWASLAPVVDVVTGLLLALCLYAKVPLARFSGRVVHARVDHLRGGRVLLDVDL